MSKEDEVIKFVNEHALYSETSPEYAKYYVRYPTQTRRAIFGIQESWY